MEIIEAAATLGYIVRLGYKITGLLFLWWRKEYRLDRMRIHLGTKQGKNVLFGTTHLVLFILTALWFVPPVRDLSYVALAVYAIGIAIVYVGKFRHWLLPPISPKVMAILVSLLYGIIVCVTSLPFPVLIALVFADLLIFPSSVVLVVILTLPTVLYHQIIIARAKRRLFSHKPMTVIGITGSYGKTSVKDYLASILQESYPTLKTEASKNSPIGIAEAVMRSLIPSHEVFVVEMGAYKRGEITRMSEMVRPEIGIVTAINPQHQDLFGTIETTMKAKYELLHTLQGRKIAIINLDDERVKTLGSWAAEEGCTVWGWTTQSVKSKQVIVNSKKIFRASNIAADMNGVSFDCHVGGEKIHVHAPVIGEHQAGNILSAIAGAVATGMDVPAAAHAAAGIRPAPKVMEVRRGKQGEVFIDDTFNNNPDAAKAALGFLARQKGKKILVFQPMIELGGFADRSHEEVGAAAGKVCDAIFLTNANHYEAFERGVRSASSKVQLSVASATGIAAYIRAHAGKGDTVLFKGKDAEHTLNLILRPVG